MTHELYDINVLKAEEQKQFSKYQMKPFTDDDFGDLKDREEDTFCRFLRLMQERLMYQNRNFKAWEAADIPKKGLKFLCDFREETEAIPDDTLVKSLDVKRKYLIEKIRITPVDKDWKGILENSKTEKGLYLKNQILVFSKEKMNVRSLAMKMILSFRITGTLQFINFVLKQ